MDIIKVHQREIDTVGFTVIEGVYSTAEIKSIAEIIEGIDTSNQFFRKTDDLFAIRQFLKQIPEVKTIIFNSKLIKIISDVFGDDYFAVKSIYFDKPEKSNWFVAWHQDLTISVNKKADLPGFGPWTVKVNQFRVLPPLNILNNNFTIRVHLDPTDENNGALKVIPGSHLRGIYRAEEIDWSTEKYHYCNVNEGGVMIMRPLLMHASDRNVNDIKRRVLHIEFSNVSLPKEIEWAEKEIF